MTAEQVTCLNCGGDVPGRYRLCGHCGAVLSESPPEEIRRQATIVTSDLKGSTALGERLDPESLREVMTTYIDEMRAVFEGHGGTIEKIIGDAIVSVFGLPSARDDDALRAVEAAAESQRALASLNDRLEQRWGVRLTVRTGVASGDVVVGEAAAGQHVLTGPTIAIATAMEQNSPPQEVLMADSTYRAVRDAVEVEPMPEVTPKGSTLSIPSYRLVSVAERHAGSAEQEAAKGMRICQTCGEENPQEFRFCGACGAQLAPRQAIRDTRKTVTVVFADPKPSTADGTPPTPEALRDVMTRYFAGMQRALDRHGATVEKFIGDAVMAVFGLPVRHEDDALRAVRAATDMQKVLPELNAAFEAEHGISLANHIGVNTGEVVAGDASLGQRLVTGDTVNVAARLEQAAGAREILLGGLTYRLVRDAVSVEEVEPLTLKGKSEPVPAYRLLSVSDALEGFQRRQDAPMVGRDEELQSLRGLFDRARTEQVCRMATVVGDAGVGKSRLIAEFTAEHEDEALVIRGRCLPYGDGITFWPLREAVREAAGIGADDGVEVALGKLHERIPDPDVCDRLASVIGLSEQPFPVPEVFWGARRFLESLAADRPVLMVIDDIHWAEGTFLELVTHLVEAVEAAPALLLCSARHELLERHTDWAQADDSLRLVLAPLTDADAGRVVEALVGGTGLDESVRSRIVQAAAGNPLFVEQLLSMLIDEGTLQREGDTWVQVGDLTRLRVPPTIQALLAARLDLLDPDERGVIEPASVVGQNFAVAAVTQLVAQPIAPAVPDHLEAMSRKQLVQPNPGAVDEEAAYRFHHLLVRDAAYGGLLKRARAELHERFVNWAEEEDRRTGRGSEFEEIQGYHLEQAYRYLTELGTVDDHALELGMRGSRKLAAAGHRALARGDFPAAASLLRRAASIRTPHDRERLLLLPILGEALTELGEFSQVREVLADATASADAVGETVVSSHARLVRLYAQLYAGETEGATDWTSAASAAIDEALPVFEAAAYVRGLTFAWRLRVGISGAAQQAASTEHAAQQVIQHARAGNDFRAEVKGSLALAHAATYGPMPVPEARKRLESLAARASGDQHAGASIGLLQSQLLAMAREFDAARDLYRSATAKLVELHAGFSAVSTSMDSGRVEMLASNFASAVELLERDFRALDAMGERYLLASVAGLLARALARLGRLDEADRYADQAASVSAADDVDAQAIWRGAKARVLASQGSFAEAIPLAREAAALRADSDYLSLRAEALMDLAAVLAAAGADDEARRVLDEAADLAEAKGDMATLDQIRTMR